MDDLTTTAAEAARERQSHVRHELRAPLAVIYPLLSLLLDGGAGELTPEQREFLEVLDRNVVRLEGLVAGMTDSGWADCSAAPMVPSEFAVRDVVEEILALRRIDGEAGPPVTIEPGPARRARARADRDDVRQIVADLIGNAAAYTPPVDGVTVRLAADEAAGTVTVAVVDRGPGILPEELARVFEFGFRGELARRLRVPGLGAGLWVCRRLAGRNAGTVELASRPGAGTTALLTLPAAGGRR
jgi:signal transduction histidine kinase